MTVHPSIPPDFELHHVSVSQLRTFYQCGIRWAFENTVPKELRVEAPGWSGRLRGTALDRAANAHFDQKLVDGKGLPKAEFIELAVATHEAGVDSHLFDIDEIKSKDRTAKIAKEYRETFGEVFKPWAGQAQEKFEYTDDELILPVHGIIDLRTDSGVIVDNKVKRKKNVPAPAAVDADFQLTTYSMATGWSNVALAIVTDEDRPEAKYITSARTSEQVANVKDRYNQMIRSIRAGILHPAPENSWYCNQRWCPWWSACSYGGAEERPMLDSE